MASAPGMLADSLVSNPQEEQKGKGFLRLSMPFGGILCASFRVISSSSGRYWPMLRK